MAESVWTASDFDFALPEELIAQTPSDLRGESRLLVVDRAAPADAARRDLRFPNLLQLIPAGDLLVLNSTKVRHARLLGTTPRGGAAEVLLIHPGTDGSWIAMGKPGRAMQPGREIVLGEGISVETLEIVADGMRRVRFLGATAEVAIRRFGRLPLPPYITRTPTAVDEERYQTVYAQREGSVAAPTAGLHFTSALMASLRERGVQIAELDLEVGPGTFRPLDGEEIASHQMHAERYQIPQSLADAVAACRHQGGKVWAVGTTVVRALESAALSGALLAGEAETRLMITPGFSFHVVDHLITNFHLPRSTLLMLVAAFAGHSPTMAAYHHAVASRYRFYSYGDAMCIL